MRAFACGCLAAEGAQSPRVVPIAIDPNRASVDELQSLPGVAAGRAEAIVLDRVRHGVFRSLLDLDRVDGIGAVILEGLRPFLVLGDGQESGGSH